MKAYYQKRQRDLVAQIAEVASNPTSESQEKELHKLKQELANFNEVLGRKEFNDEPS